MRKKIQKKINFFKFTNCFQANENQILKNFVLFPKEQPTVLELGCGKASFSLELARKNPHKNFIAIDTKINRLADGAQIALSENLTNIIFVQMHIEQILLHFEYQQMDTIWITFPDPYPKDRHEKHRLTNQKFLIIYHHLLNPNGKIFFKTDNIELFDYTLSVLKQMSWKIDNFTYDLHHSDLLNIDNAILTEYEKKFVKLSKKICYLELSNCLKNDDWKLIPIPVFSAIKKWTPSESVWQNDTIQFFQDKKDLFSFEEYDTNMQFARTLDFKNFIWLVVKGEVRVEITDGQSSKHAKFLAGDCIDFDISNEKIYAITISRTQLIKIPKN